MSVLSELNDIFKCTFCNSLLESPIILPCSETICEKHLNEMKSAQISSKNIKCTLCTNQHQIPADGFIKDTRLQKLMSREK